MMRTESNCSSLTGSAGELAEVKNSNKEVVLSWRNLSVVVSKKQPKKSWFQKSVSVDSVILNNVSGYCKSGVLTAVMGASGAGKTTLLATISHRAKFKREGDLLFNGRDVSAGFMAKVSGFVPQHDLVFTSLTVSEHMEFMAALMMDRRTRKIHRYRRICSLLTDLGLVHCCKTRLSKLSGGEMKRVSLAVQLLTDPPLLFCDEPTTGLDSYSAGIVLEHLRQCAERGKAVLATIHQPASGHFDLFHEVLLLAAGRVAYTGPVNEASSYFNSMGLVCPASYNPAEFYVQQLAVLPGRESECLKRNDWLCDQFVHSARGLIVDEIVMQEVYRYRHRGTVGIVKGNWSTHSSTTSESLIDVDYNRAHDFDHQTAIIKQRVPTQLYFLLWRSYLDMKRNCADIILRFVLLMMIGALISSPYIGITKNVGQNTIQNLEGLMHLIVSEVVFACAYNVFHTFPAEIPILLRELANGLYTPSPYYISKMILILCRTVVESMIYASFIYLTVQLNGGFLGLIIFVFPVVISAVTATAYGTVMSAAFESIDTANLMAAPIDMIGIMFSGIYVSLLTLPKYIAWIKYLSIFYYGQEAISITQWTLIPFIECFSDPNLPCIATGEGALYKYGYHADNYLMDIVGLMSLYICLHAVGFTALWIRSRKSASY